MVKYKLVYFKDCPNYPPFTELLNQLGVQFESVCQDDLEAGNPLKGYSSPTLIKDDDIVIGSKANGGGCSISLPSLEELKNLIAIFSM